MSTLPNRHPTPKGSKQSLSVSPGTRSVSGGNGGSSMPSSPTSIHSSSSAIFERDIEVAPKNCLSPNQHAPLATKDPHHTARAIAHEPLENAVPSVLTAAVAALGEYEGTSKDLRRGLSFDEISVIAPVAPQSPNHWPSASSATAGGSRYGMSRSPSPHALPLPLPSVGMASSTSSGASTPGSSPSRIGSRQTSLPQRVASANANAAPSSPVIPGAYPTITTSLTPATDPGLVTPNVTDSNVASRGSTPGIIGIVPPTPNANTFSFSAFHGGNSTEAIIGGSPPSATASPLIMTPPLHVGSRPDTTSRSASRPTSLYDELSLAPLVITSGVDEPLEVPSDVEPIAFSGNAPSHHPPSPLVQPTPRDTLGNSAASKRLSFISYNDLLNSTPISSFPLSNLTSPNSSVPEPPHQIEVSVKTGSRQSTISPVSDVFVAAPQVQVPIVDGESMEDVGVAGSSVAPGAGDSQGGGEWERGGFRTGLEARLEAAFQDQQATKE